MASKRHILFEAWLDSVGKENFAHLECPDDLDFVEWATTVDVNSPTFDAVMAVREARPVSTASK